MFDPSAHTPVPHPPPKKKRPFVWRIAPLFGLVFLVPWFFMGKPTERFLGYPAWSWYVVATCIGYASLVAFCLRKTWREGGDGR